MYKYRWIGAAFQQFQWPSLWDQIVRIRLTSRGPGTQVQAHNLWLWALKFFIDTSLRLQTWYNVTAMLSVYLRCIIGGNTPLRLSTFRLLQVRLVYYAFYNFAFYNFAWNVMVRHLVYLTSVFHNVSLLMDLQQMLCAIPRRVWRTSRRFSLRSKHSVQSQRCSCLLSLHATTVSRGVSIVA